MTNKSKDVYFSVHKANIHQRVLNNHHPIGVTIAVLYKGMIYLIVVSTTIVSNSPYAPLLLKRKPDVLAEFGCTFITAALWNTNSIIDTTSTVISRSTPELMTFC